MQDEADYRELRAVLGRVEAGSYDEAALAALVQQAESA